MRDITIGHQKKKKFYSCNLEVRGRKIPPPEHPQHTITRSSHHRKLDLLLSPETTPNTKYQLQNQEVTRNRKDIPVAVVNISSECSRQLQKIREVHQVADFERLLQKTIGGGKKNEKSPRKKCQFKNAADDDVTVKGAAALYHAYLGVHYDMIKAVIAKVNRK